MYEKWEAYSRRFSQLITNLYSIASFLGGRGINNWIYRPEYTRTNMGETLSTEPVTQSRPEEVIECKREINKYVL